MSNEKSTARDETAELPDESLESVAGGIIDGGCIPDPCKPVFDPDGNSTY